MTYSKGKIGGVGSDAYLDVQSNGSVVVSDGTTPITFTTAIWTKLVGLGGFIWDLTGATTGAAYIGLTDNLASAFALKVGSTAYLTFKSTTNAARVIFGKTIRLPAMTTVTIAANHTLVVGTPAANQTQIAGNIYYLDNTSGSSKNLTLPAYSVLTDEPMVFLNGSGNDVVILDSAASTIVTATAGKITMVFNNGSGGLGSCLP